MWQKLLPTLLLVLAMIFLQLGAALAKQLFPHVGTIGATTLRLTFSAICLLLFFRPWKLFQQRAAWGSFFVFALCLGGMNFFFYLSIERIPLGIAVALEFLGPLSVALFFSRKLLDFLWIVLACLGIFLITPFFTIAPTHLDPIGLLYVLIAAIAWGLYIVVGQKISRQYGSGSFAIAIAISAVMVLPLGVGMYGSLLLEPEVLLLGLGVAVLSSALPYGLEAYVLRKIDARTFGTLLCFEPACASFIGLFFLNEIITFYQWVAIGLIMTASVGATFFQRRR